MKYLLSSLVGLAISMSVFAQNPGVDYAALGENELAKEYFMKTMRQAPAESYYYLGQMALEEGNQAEAKSNFEKGLAGNPESFLNMIGLAKLNLKSNEKEAIKELNDIKKKAKKDVTVIIEVARAFAENGKTEEATKALDDARKADKKSPYIYIFEGTLLEKAGNVGDAAMQYDQAINFDPNCTLAYIKGANVYESINPPTAIEMLKKAIQIKPDYRLAHKYIASVYFKNGFYDNAIASYKTYFASGPYTIEDVRGLAASQYFRQDYASAKATIEKEGLSKEPNHFVLNRLLMYSDNELKNYEDGAVVGERFFSIPRDTAKYIVQDHMSYGNILSNVGQKDKALVQFEKAIELDPSKVELFKDIATACAEDNMYPEAGDYYQKYIDHITDKVEATDYFQMGRYYYLGANALMKDSTKMDQAPAVFSKADVAFGKVMELAPEGATLGQLWRARTNASLDPETTAGLAKPYYESLVEVVTASESTEGKEDELKEAYRYLSYYHYLQFEKSNTAAEKAKTKEYCERLLELDPANSVGLQLLEAVK